MPYLTDDAEEQAENPAMGWRALRLSLDRSTLMKAQARALIDASGGKVLRVMFPMISEPWEYEEARALFEEQVEWARKGHRKMPKRIEFGAMLEVPSLAEMLDQLLPRVDFISVGTNDLTQFLFAADRSDPRLAQRYDWLSPAILRFLKRVLDQARAANVPVRICGEMAGRPLEAMALIGLGAENFSITPAGVGPVKAMVRSLDAAAIRGAAWTSCSPSRPGTCARRWANGRGGITSSLDSLRLTLRPQPSNRAHGQARLLKPKTARPRSVGSAAHRRRTAPRRAGEEEAEPRGRGCADADPPAPSGEHRERRVGQSSRADLHHRFRQELCFAVGLDRAEIGDQLREEMGGQRFATTSADVFEPADPRRTMPKSLVIGAVIAADRADRG